MDIRDLRRDNRSVLLWSLYFDQPCSPRTCPSERAQLASVAT